MQPYPPNQPQQPYAPDQSQSFYSPQQPYAQTPPPPPTGSYEPTMPGQAQWQQQTPPYTPAPGQMPAWQGGPPPPKKKSRKGLWIGIGIVVLVVIIIGAAANSGKGTSNNPQPTQSTNAGGSTPTQASQPTAAATHNAGMHRVGESVTLDGWTIKVNSVKTSPGGQFDTPQKASDVFLEVNVSIVNNTGQTQPVSSLLSFTLKDDAGQKYDETIVTDAPSPPDGNVANGGKIKGTVSYEVPKSTKSFEFDFTPSLTSTDMATWSLTV